MNRRLKFCQASLRVVARLSLLALVVLPISCLSRKPETDKPEAEAPQVQEGEDPALSDDTGGEVEEEPKAEASSPAPSEPATRSSIDSEASGDNSASTGAVSELTGPDSEAAAPGLESDSPDPVAAVSEESAQAFSATAPAIIPDRQSEAPEVNPLVDGSEAKAEASSPAPSEPATRGSIDSEASGDDSASIDAASELTGPDSEAAGPELESDSPDPAAAVSEESAQAFSATAPAIIPDRQSEAPEINPLVNGSETKSEEAGEVPKVASSQVDSEIDPLVAAAGPEQPIQASEADSSTSEVAPTHFMESPGEITITLESIGWIFRSDRSTPGAWRFLGREIVGDSTSFRFLLNEVGKWDFVFERQDISGGESEEVIREVAVSESDGSNMGSISIATPNSISGTLPANADTRYAAALSASEAGRSDEAIKYYEQDASRNDSAGARARGALVETAAKSGAVGSLLTWLPRYLEENPKPEVLRAALEVFTGEAGYDAQSRAILEKLAESEGDYPEWPYRLAVLLEKPGEERDLDRAARLYQEVINRWPLSEWRDRSEERLLWLQRHYFRVR